MGLMERIKRLRGKLIDESAKVVVVLACPTDEREWIVNKQVYDDERGIPFEVIFGEDNAPEAKDLAALRYQCNLRHIQLTVLPGQCEEIEVDDTWD
jgi:hypothetical protein